jgi:hypothetical protein
MVTTQILAVVVAEARSISREHCDSIFAYLLDNSEWAITLIVQLL